MYKFSEVQNIVAAIMMSSPLLKGKFKHKWPQNSKILSLDPQSCPTLYKNTSLQSKYCKICKDIWEKFRANDAQ